MTAVPKVTVQELEDKYPTFSTEFAKNWRFIVKKALADQVRRNPLSNSLRGLKDVAKNHFTLLLEDKEWNKVVNMLSQRFIKSKHSPEWDQFREMLPNIFPEKSIGQLSWFEDAEGIPDSVSTVQETPSVKDDGCAVIIIQHGNFKSEYSNVPSEVALMINAELSKSLA